MPNKIFITGCPRSGTTLLLRMFFAFNDIEVIPHEVNIREFVSHDSPKKFIIGKRIENHLFSDNIKLEQLNNQLEVVKSNNVQILNIVRDGRDVIEDVEKNVTCNWWNNTIDQLRNNNEFIDLIVKYEDLVFRPDEVQEHIQLTFNLTSHCNFSNYPAFIPEGVFSYTKHKPRYNIGKISKDRVGKDLNAYKKKCSKEERKEFEKNLKYLKYI